MDRGFIDRVWEPELGPLDPDALLLAAAFETLSASPANGGGASQSPWRTGGGWRVGGGSRTYRYRYEGQDVVLLVSRGMGNELNVVFDGDEHTVGAMVTGPRVALTEGSRVIAGWCLRTRTGLAVNLHGRVMHLARPGLEARRSIGAGGHLQAEATAPMPGTVVKVVVEPGQVVKAQDALVVMEAMKMEHVIEAPHDGTVVEVLFAEGDMVPAGAAVVRLEEL